MKVAYLPGVTGGVWYLARAGSTINQGNDQVDKFLVTEQRGMRR